MSPGGTEPGGTGPGWPVLDAVLAAFGFVPSRTGSVISTIYGDAILPRGGSLALADLLTLMQRLGASQGVVRTAVSRLAHDGTLVGRRIGRSSAYALSPAARVEFEAAIPTIYGRLDRDWNGTLHLVLPDPTGDRPSLPGFNPLAPGLLLGLDPPPPGLPALQATGSPADLAAVSLRAWPTTPLDAEFETFVAVVSGLLDQAPPTPLDAAAARIILVHAYRRLALRTPRLPLALRPADWPGEQARQLFQRLYRGLAPLSEQWLDQTNDGSAPLPRGADPLGRFR